ncbi:MAG: hypothetical protein CSA34_02005 [Desulfobulbus propionicus]|nr:MAG: hypothetical protein CSA34_02005 [Desulfobulbus propionicus]
MRDAAFFFAVLLLLSFFGGCSVTSAPTESTTETLENVLEATTDHSSSTSPGADSSAANRAADFIRLHYADVQKDMAQGEGEYLEALGELLGVLPARLPEFCALGYTSYSSLYGQGRQESTVLAASLARELALRPDLVLAN